MMLLGRNMDNIQFETIRKRVDAIIMELSDDLKDAYYNYWQHGKSKKFYDWDVSLIEKDGSKKQFDILYGAIFHLQVLLYYEVNKIYQDYSEQYLFEKDSDTLGKVKASQSWLSDAEKTGFDFSALKNRIETWVNENKSVSISLDQDAT